MNTYQSIEEFKVEICDCIYTRYEKSIEEKNRFTLVLSGGNTPRGIYEYLGDNYLNRINWSKVYFFWLDERCTAPENLDSNYFMAHSHLLSKLDHVGGIYRIRGELDKERATRLYLKELNSFFGTEEICFDLILLGMGTDGHIASIFPGLEHSEKTKEIVFYTNKEYNGYYRISLGLDVINACKYNLLMLKGREKIEIFKNGNESHLLPKDLVNFSKIICIDDE
ncbi:MAG: 6-phosphogluconolactonase [Bacteroidota bacterium]